MRLVTLGLAVLVSTHAPDALAQLGVPVEYEITFPNAAHHEAEIAVTFRNLATAPLQLRMSRSSPGRYATHEFAKNVYHVRAEDEKGRELEVVRVTPQQWNVAGHRGTVVVRYTLFADRADGTYSGIDRTHAHLNIPATFMWARGLDRRPIGIRFRDLPPGWLVATQLKPGADSLTFSAPNLQLFMDSPIEVSAFDRRSWIVRSDNVDQTIQLVIHHTGTPAEVDTFVSRIQRVVREHAAVFGELPRYDNGVYTFLADYLPYVSGDGMEHRNSTILASTGSLATAMVPLLGTASHEFFHGWNVERIRPRSLEPFNFEDANMSGELWLAEGVTSYYGPLAIQRAGLSTLDDYARGLSGDVNAVINRPGRRYYSPREMSMLAPFVDAATALDPTNFSNIFISYYTWGAALGLALDLELRTRFTGVTLDDYMREMWRAHGKTERPYTNADAGAALARVTPDSAFAREFWRRFVDGREATEFARLLGSAGLLLRPASPGKAWLGDQAYQLQGDRVVISGATLMDQPLYRAGLDRGDRIVLLDGKPVLAAADIDSILVGHRPGDVIPISFESRSGTVESTVELAESPRVEIVTFEAAGREVSPAMQAFRAAWLGSHVK